MLSHQQSAKSEVGGGGDIPVNIAEHLTLDSGDLVFQETHGVLKFTRHIENVKYHNVRSKSLHTFSLVIIGNAK